MRPIFIVFHILALLLILLVSLAPVISVAVAGSIAAANGCTLNESQAHPCIINGVDQGDNLYAMGMLGWLMLVTLPVGGLVFILYLIILIVYFVWKKWRQKAGARVGA